LGSRSNHSTTTLTLVSFLGAGQLPIDGSGPAPSEPLPPWRINPNNGKILPLPPNYHPLPNGGASSPGYGYFVLPWNNGNQGWGWGVGKGVGWGLTVIGTGGLALYYGGVIGGGAAAGGATAASVAALNQQYNNIERLFPWCENTQDLQDLLDKLNEIEQKIKHLLGG
jgi:hypothetical protein